MRRIVVTSVAVLSLAAAALGAVVAEREPLDIRVFAPIGPPGQPEPVAIGPDRRVYVGTNQLGHGDTDAPSKVFAFSRKGEPVREYVIEGQPLDESHGIQGLVFDRDGTLYALDRSADPRVIAVDPATGDQRRYASFRDVPSCGTAPGSDGEECSDTRLDGPAGPDYATFAPDGDLYVTDIDQALIWRVPKGGGRAEIWLTDARLESLYGPNGIQFMADERTLLFVNTASNPSAGNALTGRLYTVVVQDDGSPGELTQVWESLPVDAPDGIAIAQSGNVYVAVAGSSQVLKLSPEFTELARVPPDPAANQSEEIPVDAPGSLAFLGERLLVSNHSAIRGDPESWAILDVFAGERGLPLHYPRIARPRLFVAVRARRAEAGDHVRLRVRVTRHLASLDSPVRGGRVRARRQRARTDRDGVARLRLATAPGAAITVRARKRGFVRAKRPIAAP
ncbi:MAG TPA: SMP-30/gluconolactonase/LRE family protein [Thermoleophilaceae bacterium]|nr:SMP-30/gluconolactonase/LRE family protein [Thermoleophilaceae bacterium]